MLFPTHLAVAIGTTIILKHFGIHNGTLTIALFVGALAPDFDVIWAKGIQHHRKTVFHMPLFWVLVASVASLFSPMIGLGVLIGALEHMILDLFNYSIGLRLLAPFSTRELSIIKLTPYTSFSQWTKGYLKSKLFVAEMLIITLVIVMFLY